MAVPGAHFSEDFSDQHAAAHGVADQGDVPRRSSTLKKKNSVNLKGSASKRSRAGSVSIHDELFDEENKKSAFYTPVPTQSNPTEILTNRFQAWRRVLKDSISYYREVQAQYELRARGISKITHTLDAALYPTEFLPNGGIMEKNNALREFHREAMTSCEYAAKIETEVVVNLTNLRNDLNLKVKEIKGLSGDFKSNIEKEKEATKKEVLRLQEVLVTIDTIPSPGKDPYIIKLGLENQLRKQLQEENYLHRAYLNLEASGRELEKIVVREIQKAYGTYVKILAREGQELLNMADRLTQSTLQLSPDLEWNSFIQREPAMVDPAMPLRSMENIEYPGCHHPAVTDIRSGMLERRSKYLKSFTAAWYTLSPTHLHEFKSPDRSRDMNPVMSLYLPGSSLGRHSDPAGVSHKFVLNSRQTGALHRDHSWVFRAESHEAMLGWYESIKKLTEISGAERNAYVQGTTSYKHTASEIYLQQTDSNSDNGLDNDEADEVPFSGRANSFNSSRQAEVSPEFPRRPEAGRFPSDLRINLIRRDSVATSEGSSSASAVAANTAMPGSSYPVQSYGNTNPGFMDQSYVMVPPIAQQRSQADPVSTYDEMPHENRREHTHQSIATERNLPQRDHDRTGVHFYDNTTTTQRTPLVTGYGIDPIIGEHASQAGLESVTHRQQRNNNDNVVFLEADEAERHSPVDPREPLYPTEVDKVAIDPLPMDAVANDEVPFPAECHPSHSPVWPPHEVSVDGISYSNLATSDYMRRSEQATETLPIGDANHGDRPQSTISNLPIPGKYPSQV